MTLSYRLTRLALIGLPALVLGVTGCTFPFAMPIPATVSPVAPARTAPPTTAASVTPPPATAPATELAATEPPLASDLAGQWLAAEPFPVDPARAGYALFTFNQDAGTGAMHLPLSESTRPFDSFSQNGSEVAWQLTDGDRVLSFAGQVSGGALSATVTLNGETQPLALTHLAEGVDDTGVLGWYAVSPDHLIAVFLDDGALTYRDWLTGRLSPLLPIAPDVYVGGPAWRVPAPVETTVTFSRTNGAVTGLLWEQAGQSALSAARVPADFYATSDTTFANGDVTLAGTLVTPRLTGAPADALYPAVVMLHGSEPGRRRDTYRWLAAEWLAYYGIASLVYDKRGVGGSTGTYVEAASDRNLDNLAHDALAGFTWLQTQPNIDPHQIGALGASQAGWVGPRLAALAPDLAFLVMVVGPVTSLGQEQLYKSLLANHPPDAQAQRDPAITRQVRGIPPTPFDPLTYLRSVTMPALWIYGGLDATVPGYAGVEIITELRAAGQTNLEAAFYPDGNHSLFASRTGYPAEMPYLPGFIPGWNAAEMQWILDHVTLPTSQAGQPVSVPLAAGTALSATRYGAGDTAVILATTSDTHQDTWAATAQSLALSGYTAYTFDFSFWLPDGERDFARMNAADADLQAVVDYARAQGARRVVAIGASLGGLAAAKIAAPAALDGLIILGAPLDDPALTLAVTAADLAPALMPKLIILSDSDPVVAPARTQALYAAAPEPKELVTYPTTEHATALLTGPHAADLQARLLAFLAALPSSP